MAVALFAVRWAYTLVKGVWEVTIVIREDFVQSIADALQFISYYHPVGA